MVQMKSHAIFKKAVIEGKIKSKMKKKCISKSLLSLFLAVTLVIGFCPKASAANLYNIELKWNSYTNASNLSKSMTIRWYNNNVSDTNYTSNIASAFGYWKYFYGVTATRVYNMNDLTALISFSSPTSTWWNNRFSATVAGVCYPYDTSGREINSATAAQASTKKIRSASIYFNPNKDDIVYWGANAQAYRNTIVHEVGHALGFGHYNGTSIMNPDYDVIRNYTSLQPYDKSEFARKYYSNPS